MIIQCRFCLHVLRLVRGQATYCQCGTAYMYNVQMDTGNSTSTTTNKDYDALHRQAVPQAFYDAFKDEEVQP
jgi:hypothetical protein